MRKEVVEPQQILAGQAAVRGGHDADVAASIWPEGLVRQYSDDDLCEPHLPALVKVVEERLVGMPLAGRDHVFREFQLVGGRRAGLVRDAVPWKAKGMLGAAEIHPVAIRGIGVLRLVAAPKGGVRQALEVELALEGPFGPERPCRKGLLAAAAALGFGLLPAALFGLVEAGVGDDLLHGLARLFARARAMRSAAILQ